MILKLLPFFTEEASGVQVPEAMGLRSWQKVGGVVCSGVMLLPLAPSSTKCPSVCWLEVGQASCFSVGDGLLLALVGGWPGIRK